MGAGVYLRLGRRDCFLPMDGRRAVEVTDLPLIAWCAWGALCMIFGMLIMALARVERGDLDEDAFENYIDD